MAEDESYEEEIQIISEKLTTSTTIESVFNPVQRKGRTSRSDTASSSTGSGMMITSDSSSEVNKSNAIVTAAGGSTAVNITVNAFDDEANVHAKHSSNIDMHLDDKVDGDVPNESVVAVDTKIFCHDTTLDTRMSNKVYGNVNASGNASDVNDNSTAAAAAAAAAADDDDDDDNNNVNNNNDNDLVDDKTMADSPMVRNLPELNLPEKILLVIDAVREENGTQFIFGTGAMHSPLVMIKRAIETFLSAKSTIQRKHEFSLMSLSSADSQWLCDFTGNVKTLVSRLNAIGEEVSEDTDKSYDFGALFNKIGAQLPIPSGNVLGNTSFITRIILIYARSNSIPKFDSGLEYLNKLSDNPYVFLDILYVHETPSEENMCQEIYSEITRLEMNNISYIMEVGRNAAKLHECMAKLLAHPLQRPPQIETSYTFSSTALTQQMHATNV